MTPPKQTRENDIDRALARVGAKRVDPLHDSPAKLLAESRAMSRELSGLNDTQALEFYERRQDLLREQSELLGNALVLFQDAYWQAVTLISEIRGSATYASDTAMKGWEPFKNQVYLITETVESRLQVLHSVGGSDIGFDLVRFKEIMIGLHEAIKNAIWGDSRGIREFAKQSVILDELRRMAPKSGRPAAPEAIIKRALELYQSPERREWREVAIQIQSELLLIKKPTDSQRVALDWFAGGNPDRWAKNLKELCARRLKTRQFTLTP